MGWFEEQIIERREADLEALEDSFQKIAGVVLGQRIAQRLNDDRIVTKQAIDEVLKFYHLKPVEIPESITYSSPCIQGLRNQNGAYRNRYNYW